MSFFFFFRKRSYRTASTSRSVAASYSITETDKDNLRMRGIVFKDAAAAN